MEKPIPAFKFLAVPGVTNKTADVYAAAPELLDACKRVFMALEAGKSYPPAKATVQDILKQAIAKAESRA